MTGVLSALVLWCLLYGRLPVQALVVLCLVSAVALIFFGGHHGGVLRTESLARKSRLGRVNPGLKLAICVGLLVLCLCSGAIVGLLAAGVALVLGIFIGGLRPSEYLRACTVPLAFLLLGVLTLLVGWSPVAQGVLRLPAFGGYLYIGAAAQAQAIPLFCRALGAAQCLLCLAFCTPMEQILTTLKKLHLPGILLDLMYLVYRYLFLLLELHRQMQTAAHCRLGFVGVRRSLTTAGQVYAGLFGRALYRAGENMNAMESRCYTGQIAFLSREIPVCKRHVVGAILSCLPVMAAALWEAFF